MAGTTKTVILDQPSDWEPWLFIVKSIAEGGDIWKYLNPDITLEPEVPIRPIMPTPQAINPAKASIVNLDPVEKETFKLLLAIYREDNSKATKFQETL
jgi:hypothetical protein